jgi:hypothetical protein
LVLEVELCPYFLGPPCLNTAPCAIAGKTPSKTPASMTARKWRDKVFSWYLQLRIRTPRFLARIAEDIGMAVNSQYGRRDSTTNQALTDTNLHCFGAPEDERKNTGQAPRCLEQWHRT